MLQAARAAAASAGDPVVAALVGGAGGTGGNRRGVEAQEEAGALGDFARRLRLVNAVALASCAGGHGGLGDGARTGLANPNDPADVHAYPARFTANALHPYR